MSLKQFFCPHDFKAIAINDYTSQEIFKCVKCGYCMIQNLKTRESHTCEVVDLSEKGWNKI